MPLTILLPLFSRSTIAISRRVRQNNFFSLRFRSRSGSLTPVVVKPLRLAQPTYGSTNTRSRQKSRRLDAWESGCHVRLQPQQNRTVIRPKEVSLQSRLKKAQTDLKSLMPKITGSDKR